MNHSSALEILADYGSDSSENGGDNDVDVLTISHHCSPFSASEDDGQKSVPSPSAKKCLQFSPPATTHTLEVLANVAGSVPDEDEVDEIPLANLRSRARARWASKRPMESEIDSTLVTNVPDPVLPDSNEEVTVPNSESIPNLSRVATRRFTRSQTTKFLTDRCPSKKQKRPCSNDGPSDDAGTEDNIGNLSDSLPPHESDLPCPGPMFFKSGFHMSLWGCITGRTFLREHSLIPDKPNHQTIVSFLQGVGLGKTVLNVQSFVKQIVLEFYCNLSPDVCTSGKTFVRGMHVNFSPAVINSFVGFSPILGVNMEGGLRIVVKEITGGVVRTWPRSGGVRASSLSFKYSVLHKIALRNWMPNSHSSVVRAELAGLLYRIGTSGYLDFGQIVFDNIMQHAEKQALQKPVGFPSLIFGIIQSQVNVQIDTDCMDEPAPTLVITNKLRNTAYHVDDMPAPVMTDANTMYSEGQSFSDVGLPGFQRELLIRELELQSAFLGRMIKSSQSRKNLLDALLTDLRSTSDGTDATPADEHA